jgi:DNA transformation protein
MAKPLTSLSGLGPKTVAWLSEAGVNTADELRALGAVAAYVRLKRAFRIA